MAGDPHILHPGGRLGRAGFVSALVGGTVVQCLGDGALQMVQQRRELSVDQSNLWLIVVASSCAWIVMCASMKRLRDVEWHWGLALPILPINFVAVWPPLGGPSTPLMWLYGGLILYGAGLLAVLAFRQTMADQPEPAFIRCPSGHYYSRKLAQCPFCHENAAKAE